MAFFNMTHKHLAKKPTSFLQRKYAESEKNLVRASATGNTKLLKKAMKQHGKYEYALLYQNTPQFKEQRRKNRGKF